ncbi:MAG: hypothetical protein J0I06_19430 [Planctomycetes bacterium]|nr:hypothetical protein [Planctomycetota bacterium]
MRTFVPVAAILFVFGGAHAGGKAPVPKAPVPPSIDGKYTLVATYGGTPTAKGKVDPADLPAGFAPADRGNPWGTRVSTARAETTITRNEITIESRTPTGTSTTMSYTLDPTKSPMTIDVEIVPVRGKKTRALGVVEATGNRLVIALAKEGAERPKTADEAEGVTVYYFQKAPPPPKVEFKIVAMTVGKEADVEKELNRLTGEGYELVTTTQPTAAGDKASVTTIHFVLKRTTKQP